MSEITDEDLQERWERLWAWGKELDERQTQLMGSMDEIEPELFDRTLAILNEERQRYGHQLEDLKAEMKRRNHEPEG